MMLSIWFNFRCFNCNLSNYSNSNSNSPWTIIIGNGIICGFYVICETMACWTIN